MNTLQGEGGEGAEERRGEKADEKAKGDGKGEGGVGRY